MELTDLELLDIAIDASGAVFDLNTLYGVASLSECIMHAAREAFFGENSNRFCHTAYIFKDVQADDGTTKQHVYVASGVGITNNEEYNAWIKEVSELCAKIEHAGLAVLVGLSNTHEDGSTELCLMYAIRHRSIGDTGVRIFSLLGSEYNAGEKFFKRIKDVDDELNMLYNFFNFKKNTSLEN